MKPNLNLLFVLRPGTVRGLPMIGGMLLMHLVSPKTTTPENLREIIEGGVEDGAGNKVTDGSIKLGDLIDVVILGPEVVLDDETLNAARSENMLIAAALDENAPYVSSEVALGQLRNNTIVRVQIRDLSAIVTAVRELKNKPSPVVAALAEAK